MNEVAQTTNYDLMPLIAFLALIVSIVSIYIGARALKIQRTHNIKSVKPIGNIVFSDYEDHLAVNIKNAGVGPLIIKSLKVKNKNNEMKNNVIDFMPQHPPDLPWTNFFANPEDFVIPAGEKLNLIKLTTEDISDTFAIFRNTVRESLMDLSIELEYKDIYDNIMPINKRTLEWFGRNLGIKKTDNKATHSNA